MAAVTGGDWKDALKSFLDNFTKTILDSFMKGLLDPLTGENGIFSNLFRQMGQSLYGAGNSVGSSAAGAIGQTGLGNLLPFNTGGGTGGLFAASPIMNNLLSPDKGFSSVLSGGQAVQQGTEAFTSQVPGIFDNFNIDMLGSMGQGADQIGSAITQALPSPSAGAGAAGGGGFMGMSQGGIAGILGMIAGTFLAKLFAGGGEVKGPGTGTSDSIPAMLSNNEFVVRASQAQKFKPLLHAINQGRIGKYAAGGLVKALPSSGVIATPSMATIDSNKMTGGKSGDTIIHLGITGDVSRQTRKEVVKMLPEITQGVNANNHESGYQTKRD
jgi:hypothetical protein